MGIEQQAVKDIDHDDIEDRVGGQNGLCHGNAEEARVGIHGHQVIEAALVRLSAKKPWNEKAKHDEQRIKCRAEGDGRKQVCMGGRQVSRQNRGHDQSRITHVHNDGGELFGSQIVDDILFLKVNADGDENTNHAHLLQNNAKTHTGFLVFFEYRSLIIVNGSFS